MVLSAAQCLCSAFVVSAMKALLGGNAVGIKVLVDTTLFFVSYKLQHKYIFKDDRKKEAPELEEQKKRAQLQAQEEHPVRRQAPEDNIVRTRPEREG